MITFGIVLAYLLGTFMLGYILKKRKGATNTTIRKLFVADGKLPLVTISALLFGDMIAGSSTTGTAGTGYALGLAGGWAIWGNSFGCLLFSFCFCDFFFKMRRAGFTTEPEAFGLRFNQKVRYLVLIFTLIPLFIIFSAQITAASMYLSNILEIGSEISTGIAAVLFLAMALLGSSGIAEMNKVHSFVIFFGICFAAIVCVVYVGGPSTLFTELPPSYFDPFVQGHATVIAQFLGSALGFSISVTSINIGFSAKDIETAKKCHWIVAIVSILFAMFPLLIGLCGAVVFDGIAQDTVLFAMTVHISPVLSGVIVMAVFAAIFSTGPWFLLSTANLVVREIYMPISARRGHTLSNKTAVIVSRVVMVVAVIGAVFTSGQNVSLLNTLMGASQIKAITALLLIAGVYWKRITNNAAFAGLLGGGTISTIWYFTGYPFGIQPLWPGLLVAVAIFVIGSFLTSRTKISKDYREYERRFAEAEKAFSESEKEH